MRPFNYVQAKDAAGAVQAVAANRAAKFLAGGTNILDLMKEDVERPTQLIDITRLNLSQIRTTSTGISIGALAKNTDTANHPLIRQNLSSSVDGYSGRCFRTASQHGDQRGEFNAADALPVFLRHGHAVQQT